MSGHFASQTSILAPAPKCGCGITLGLLPGADLEDVRQRLGRLRASEGLVIGFGLPLFSAFGKSFPMLRAMPALTAPGIGFPSTQGAIWAYALGEDAGILVHRVRALMSTLGPAFVLEEDVLTYRYDTGRDLSGYEDGTENPVGERAADVALVRGAGPGVDGGSFVAVQKWVHELSRFESLTDADRDRIIGRKRSTNEEMADAPESAHVKRAAQESYEPAAFMVRRSMPWGTAESQGLYFVAYGASLDPFESVLRRMAGLEDGIADALLRFTRPVSGGYYFCPPARMDGAQRTASVGDVALDLRVLGE